MPWQPVIDGDVVRFPLERIDAGSAEDVDVLVRTDVDDWRLWLVVGAMGRSPTRCSPGRFHAYGYQSLAAYGLDPGKALAVPGEIPEAAPGELLAKVRTWWMRCPRDPAGRHACRPASWRTWRLHVRVRLGLARVGAVHALEVPFVFDTVGVRARASRPAARS